MEIAVGEGKQRVFHRLDLAIHAALLLCYMMRDGDTLTIIAFSSSAQVILEPTKMTAANKERVQMLLKYLRPSGGTNLLAGLRTAFATVASIPDANILVLTDGEADAGQTVDVLSAEIRKADYRGTLSTIGFTYASKSDALYGLATAGRGSFGFVSTHDMLMTVILNWTSHQLANETSVPPSETIRTYITFLKQIYDHANKRLYTTAESALQVFLKNLPTESILHKEIDGEVRLAISRDEIFRKWGCHYLLALISSHETGYCGNFKDISVQSYATPRFKEIQKMGEKIFTNNLPPLVGSLAVSTAHAAATSLHGTAAMAALYSSSGPCFAPDATVQHPDGTTSFVRDLRPGMVIKTVEGSSRIQVVVKTMTPSPVLMGNGITAWHPVLHEGAWAFPNNVYPMETVLVEFVINVVLEDRTQTVLVNGIPCCTLAHGMMGPVIGHEFWGTKAVLTSLAKLHGWADGYIVIKNYHAVRNSDGHVVDIQDHQE